jgi:hypothetical protein
MSIWNFPTFHIIASGVELWLVISHVAFYTIINNYHLIIILMLRKNAGNNKFNISMTLKFMVPGAHMR